MKGLLFFIVFEIVFCTSCSSKISQKDTDLSNLNLLEKVKSIDANSYIVTEEFGEIINLDGGIIDPLAYNPLDNIFLSFNISGNKVIEKQKFPSGALYSILHLYTYKYDSDDRKIEKLSYRESGDKSPNSKTIYKYDEKLILTSEVSYDNNDNLKSKIIYKYNKDGNIIEKYIHYFGYTQNEIDEKWIYKYNNNNNVIEENKYVYNGSLEYKSTYKYDEKGNKIEKINYKSDDIFYDENNILIISRVKVNNHNQIENKWIYKYDEKGEMIEENFYNSSNNLVSDKSYKYKYDYDKHGNWIKKYIIINNITKYLIERKIEYYN